MPTCPNCQTSVEQEATVCDNCERNLSRGNSDKPLRHRRDNRDTEPAFATRRRILTTTAAAGTLLLAGCSSDDDSGDENGDEDDGNGDENGDGGGDGSDGGGDGSDGDDGGDGESMDGDDGEDGESMDGDDGGAGGGPSPGESYSDAPQLTEGRYGPYEVSRGGEHYFAVDVDEGERLTANMYFSHADGDLDIDIYNPQEVLANFSASSTDDETVSTVANQSGTYYVRPYPYQGSNSYEIEIEIEEDPEIDSGGGGDGGGGGGDGGDGGGGGGDGGIGTGVNFGDAQQLSAGRSGPFQLTSDQEDVFALDLQEGDQVTATVYFTHDEADIDLEMYDTEQTILSSSASFTDDESITWTIEETGTYYFRVYVFRGGPTEYEIEIEIS